MTDIGNRLVNELARFVGLVGELTADNIDLRTKLMERDNRIKALETGALERLHAQ